MIERQKLIRAAKRFLKDGRDLDRAPVVREVAGWIAHGVTSISELEALTGLTRKRICYYRCVINDPSKKTSGKSYHVERYHADPAYRERVKAYQRERWVKAKERSA